MSKLLFSLLLLCAPAFADSLDCELARKGATLALSSSVAEGQAATATTAPNELGLGLDASLSPNSFFLVLQDNQSSRRVAFTASPLAASKEGSSLATGDSLVRCRKTVENPPKVMPNRPALAENLVCVLDELTFENGSMSASKRLLKTATHTALFRLPRQIKGEAGPISFTLKLNRSDFLTGFEVSLTDSSTGSDARFSGPASTFGSSFLLGLTQGDRAKSASFLRLGCAYANDPKALD